MFFHLFSKNPIEITTKISKRGPIGSARTAEREATVQFG
jgi:hypothetical protein